MTRILHSSAIVMAGFVIHTTNAFHTSRKIISQSIIQKRSFARELAYSFSADDSPLDPVADSSERNTSHPTNAPQARRQALHTLSSLAVGMMAYSSPANAFERTFPDELTETDPSIGIRLGTRSNSQQRASAAYATAAVNKSNLQNFNAKNDLFPSLVWGGALWFLLGSRSNPLATPLANLVYDAKEEAWLRDRNDGMFASPPLPFLLLLAFVFGCLGIATQFLLLQLAEGDSNDCFQLAGVSLIGGGALELGRIASGEKRATRDESDRAVQLQHEFAEFAGKRLTEGGNCHRSDIVASFRRYFAKYRQVDSEEYPLTDLEIEQLVRMWNRQANRGRAEMTSGGFYYGIQINKDADVFV